MKSPTHTCNDTTFESFILSWAEKHITKPIQGFEQKSSVNGKSLTHQELLTETHNQVLHAACYFRKKNKPLSEIMNILSFFKK